jgi:hypothetical protein
MTLCRLPAPSTTEILVPANAVGKVMGKGGANIANIRKVGSSSYIRFNFLIVSKAYLNQDKKSELLSPMSISMNLYNLIRHVKMLHSTHAWPFSNMTLYRNFGFILCQVEILEF